VSARIGTRGRSRATVEAVVTAGIPFNVPGSTNILRVAPCEERLIFSGDPE
ncbi:MAG: pyruvate kinase, partial [Pseudomonadota bacterium]